MDTSPAPNPGRISVIGIGTRFRHDDEAGRAVVSALLARASPLPEGTRLHISDGDPARLVSLWEGADLAVVVDAARAVPGRPGRVHRLEPGGGRAVPAAGTAGSHGLGLRDAIALATALDRLPARLIVYAIEAGDIGFGTGLSPEVASSVGTVADTIARELRRAGPLPTAPRHG
ncbi:hydrogenase maturation protease [Actinacidiphila acididurans]|uniref:Hydrogenase maturation protease n=1 Tax=Actinacidiphila acididurans TaxID=2784346 RepID=A0ABS2TX84_9ACTN|nr:hydrogenase maturation protease [Actinacidiphila acididurans]MBM9507955.1 hydrogenase maturation protease [Actinacidiphila acididurans]